MDRKNILRSKYKGSIAVEAAMILPIYLFAITSIMSLAFAMIFHIKMQNALCEEAKVLALRCADGRSEAVSTVAEEVKDILLESKASFGFINGGLRGIDFSQSRLDEGEYFVIKVNYYLCPLGGDIFGFNGFLVSQECVMHNWCGYINGFFDGNAYGDYVYITDNSQVYHKNRECSHIKLSVSIVDKKEVDLLRNSSGGKYYPCEICKGYSSDSCVYITKEGSKYHGSVNCSGLKRVVRAIRINQIGDRRPCSRCAR